jgi:drug/metabolite transporter superfamily protein YnfA
MTQFEDAGKSDSGQGFASELWYFLKNSKKWWLLPMVVILLAFGLLVFLSSTAAAPFIYTLF